MTTPHNSTGSSNLITPPPSMVNEAPHAVWAFLIIKKKVFFKFSWKVVCLKIQRLKRANITMKMLFKCKFRSILPSNKVTIWRHHWLQVNTFGPLLWWFLIIFWGLIGAKSSLILIISNFFGASCHASMLSQGWLNCAALWNHTLSTSSLPSSQRRLRCRTPVLAVIIKYSSFSGCWITACRAITRDWQNRHRTSKYSESFSASLRGKTLSHPATTGPPTSTALGFSIIKYMIVMASSNMKYPQLMSPKSRIPEILYFEGPSGFTKRLWSLKSPWLMPVMQYKCYKDCVDFGVKYIIKVMSYTCETMVILARLGSGTAQ